MLKLMGKKLFTILRSKFCLSKPVLDDRQISCRGEEVTPSDCVDVHDYLGLSYLHRSYYHATTIGLIIMPQL